MSKTNQISEHINDISQYLTPSQRKRLERKVKKNANNEQPTYAKTERHHQNKIASIRPIIPKTQTQKYLLDCLDYYNQNIVTGPAGVGKAQPLDSKVMTIGGWKLMKDIELYDLVLGEDGKYYNVTGIFPQGEMEVVKITFEDGRTAECTYNHLWNIYCFDYPEKNRVIDTTELIRKINKKSYKNRLYIPLISPDDKTWDEVVLPIQPYLLGVILGDGHISKEGCVNITSEDTFIIDNINNLLPDDAIIRQINDIEYKILNKIQNRKGNTIKNNMNLFGLNGKKSYEKFIPQIYLNSSLSQRIELLKGLLDTDGTVGKNGDVSYCTTSPYLANQVQDLIRSIGGLCRITTKTPSYTYNGEKKKGRLAYILSIRLKDRNRLFSLPRKLEKLSDDYQYNDYLRLRIVSVEPVRITECQCIMVDSISHLYVTDNYVVTHNTYITVTYAAQAYIKHEVDKIVITRPTIAVETSIGFFPGSVEEKMSVWLAETIGILKQTLGSEAYEIAMKHGDIEIVPFEVIRGRSLNNSFILLTEAQNTTVKEMMAFVTRTGDSSRVVIDGDINQSDIGPHNGLVWCLKMVKQYESLKDMSGIIEFTADDIVRSGLCGAWVRAIEHTNKQIKEIVYSQ